ncbi:class I SAM-dependent methyltransferase [Francisella philomiragia]|uniref:class I SAM-dependent methyltransferase n=1 Tax=Francisella philomiragia TaxID=28110 RepID=UPI001B8D35FA|nr:class I SAM-dependent methyltransferase [Francisella philomiragia]
MKKITKKVLLRIPQLRKLVIQRNSLLDEKYSLLNEKDYLVNERNSLLDEKRLLLSERDTLLTQKQDLIDERDLLIQNNASLSDEVNQYKKFVPPGHFYSPIPSNEDIDSFVNDSCDLIDNIPGIDLNTEKQLELLNKFHQYYLELPFSDNKTKNLRYHYINPAYSYSDAIMLYSMIRYLKPNNLIEVGSGYSSCVTLDTNELFFDNQINCTFIEPYADLLKSLINPDDESAKIKIIERKLQDVPLDTFKNLKENDILFIDSTHVSKLNSDVNYFIHEIFPALNSGVYIHIHDVFYPFEYPKHWISEGRAWNEQYILRSFLQYNDKFEIVLFNTYLTSFFKNEIIKKFPLLYKNQGGSIWLRKK